MKKIFAPLVALLLGFNAYSQQQPSLMPQPQSVEMQTGSFTLNAASHIGLTAATVPFGDMFNEFLKANYNFKLPRAKAVGSVSFEEDKSLPEEGYELKVTSKGISLKGNGAGLFYGLQTLQQLFPAGKATVPAITIKDAPRFTHRGLMLDVGRHFFPASYIKQYIDVMAQYKFNRFHWHLTEDQGLAYRNKKVSAPPICGISAQTNSGRPRRPQP
ncbi:family 20 glycosylhydrolase [Chitinophaga sedimenti]|uniref:glycoside hydrolase family 20 zincin-like fold domain-containing protein n=1 Tax=Chitinophaga sedimenti TaxID=2033606 RepID=UPI0020060D11|nr:glycoside hydrolase family 20 zincin-like fold domain-containing protein [Chitinophaga sedimenti]MCK7560165.1 family 20 glycosylhydrolase [Chitinophaga sedimenti]